MTPDPSPRRRLPGVVKTVVVLLVLTGLGGGAAFVLAGKLAPHAKPPAALSSPTPSPTARPTDCAATPSVPQPVVQPSQSPAIPGSYTVNTPLGVNLRAAPSATSALITLLSQGTTLTVTAQSADGAGNRWDQVSVGTRTGWVRSDFVAAGPIKPLSSDHVSLMIPAADSWTTLNGVTDVDQPAVPMLPFLRVQTSTSDALAVQLPAAVRMNVAARSDHTALIQVWNYTVLKVVTRVALNACTVPDLLGRPDGGWPYMTSVVVHAPGRTFRFTFFSSTPDDPVVQQVLDSVAMS